MSMPYRKNSMPTKPSSRGHESNDQSESNQSQAIKTEPMTTLIQMSSILNSDRISERSICNIGFLFVDTFDWSSDDGSGSALSRAGLRIRRPRNRVRSDLLGIQSATRRRDTWSRCKHLDSSTTNRNHCVLLVLFAVYRNYSHYIAISRNWMVEADKTTKQ